MAHECLAALQQQLRAALEPWHRAVADPAAAQEEALRRLLAIYLLFFFIFLVPPPRLLLHLFPLLPCRLSVDTGIVAPGHSERKPDAERPLLNTCA